MARKKEIDKKKILDAAYKLAVRNGMESLTARNIAKAVHCSTQPIYLEFENMSDLHNQVLEKISNELKSSILQQSFTGKPLIDLDLSYIYFAKDHIGLFRAMFVDSKFGNDMISDTLMELGMTKFKEQFGDDGFDDEHLRHIIVSNWISATGIAALQLNEMVNLSQEQIITVLESQLNDAISNDPLKVNSED